MRTFAIALSALLCAAGLSSITAAAANVPAPRHRAVETVQAPPPRLNEHALLRTVAAMYRLDPALLEAIARSESALNPAAVSPAGAIGLMQLMPATARRFGVHNPFDPVENALGAARFLSYLRALQIARTGSGAPTPELIAAYNAGEGAVQRYGGVPPYHQTREYVRRVLWRYFLGAPAPAAPRVRSRSEFLRQCAPSAAGYDLRVLRELRRLRVERGAAASRLQSRFPGRER